MNRIVSVPFIPLFIPFMSLPNSLDSERSHTSLVLGSTMSCLYSIMLIVLGFSIAFMYLLVSVSDKVYTMLCWMFLSCSPVHSQLLLALLVP